MERLRITPVTVGVSAKGVYCCGELQENFLGHMFTVHSSHVYTHPAQPRFYAPPNFCTEEYAP